LEEDDQVGLCELIRSARVEREQKATPRERDLLDNKRGRRSRLTHGEGASRHKKKELGRYRDVADSEQAYLAVSCKTTRADDGDEKGRNEIAYLSLFHSSGDPCYTFLPSSQRLVPRLVETTCQFF
jgi:hypothetical protein